MSETAAAPLSRALLSAGAVVCVVLAALVGLAAPAVAAPPVALVDVTCTAAVSYGDEVDCSAASIDPLGDYGTPGIFTFDPGHVLPASWSASSCAVDADTCYVSAQVAAPPAATARTFDFTINFVGHDGSRSTTEVSVDVSLRPTVTTVTCDQTERPLGGSVHCVIAAVDQLWSWDSRPAELPAGVLGMTASSSAAGDVLTYDTPAPDGSTCVAAVVDGALQCGFTLSLDSTHGLHTIVATFPGDPAADEVPSQGTVDVANGPRQTAVIALACPSSVPALQPQTTCSVTVSAPPGGGPPPSGTVELDQALGQPFPFDSGVDCTLVDGSCTIPYEIFEGTESVPAPPVRALYSGDGNYQAGSASQAVAILPTASVSDLVCEQATPTVGSDMHCQLALSTADGQPVPVGPQDAVEIEVTSGSVTCDLPAAVGCGHLDTTGATLVGFTVHVATAAGPQGVTGSYTGDRFAQIAPARSTFGYTAVALPVSSDAPPVVTVAKRVTTSSVVCAAPVAYGHVASCVVTVKAKGGVPSGTVRLAPLAGGRAFTARSCTLTVKGQCTFALGVSASPGSKVTLVVSYSGSAGFDGSAAIGRLAVRAVATSVTVRCDHAHASVGAVVHCVAAVRTEFGGPAAAPVQHRSQVTVTARGDQISYAGGGACHWKRSGRDLTCAFSVRIGSAQGSRTIHAYYAGASAAKEAASKGSTSLRATGN